MKRKKIALLTGIVGAYYVAELNYIGYIMWIVGNFIWLQDAYRRRDKEQFILWLYYIVVSVLGIINLI